MSDYFIEELANSFRLGRQVWEDDHNHEAKKELTMEALMRAKLRFKLSRSDLKNA